MDDIEKWRQLFREELDSVESAVKTIPARSVAELEAAISTARRLTEIPRAGFR